MKLWTCFSALVSSSFRATTATTKAVQPAPWEKHKADGDADHTHQASARQLHEPPESAPRLPGQWCASTASPVALPQAFTYYAKVQRQPVPNSQCQTGQLWWMRPSRECQVSRSAIQQSAGSTHSIIIIIEFVGFLCPIISFILLLIILWI